MVTGGKGVHVIAPLVPRAEWPEVKDFAHRFAQAVAQSDPENFTAALPKAQRKGRIFVDYLRNQRGATAVMPYGVRARARRAGRGADHLEGDGDDRHAGTTGTSAMPSELVKRAGSKALVWLGPRRPSAARPVKIATYNVNGVNGRLPVLLRWLEESQPDIVCLQELKAPQEKFPGRAIRDLGYDAIWHGQKSWNGVAILSRVGEIHETRRGLPGDPDDSAEPLHRGGGQRHPDRRPLPAQRQPAARAQVRLQAAVVRPADRARRRTARSPACRSCWRATST